MKSKQRSLPAINIQWPWSELIASGIKTVETRGYAIPQKYVNEEMLLIETPGKSRGLNGAPKAARIIAVIRFGEAFEYLSHEQWLRDDKRHCVKKNDLLYAFSTHKKKWGWPVVSVHKLADPKEAPKKKGIRFTQNVSVTL